MRHFSTGMSEKTLRMLHGRREPLATSKTLLAVAPPRKTRCGGALALPKVHWVKPELVAEVTYLTRSDEGLLRYTVFVGLREDKQAREVGERRQPRAIISREAGRGWRLLLYRR
jgi:ATP-dependent DNA ligase